MTVGDLPVRANVLGTHISLTGYGEVAQVLATSRSDRARVVAVCNVHSVMSARRDRALAAALDEADIATPDGMPLVWALRALARPGQNRVYGPELMHRALISGLTPGWKHFLYGTTQDTLDRLQRAIHHLAPGAVLVGTIAPPFRPLTPEEEDDVVATIRRSGAQIVWVGLGMPKQELWMHGVRHRLPGVTLVGVGAAFDILAGTVRQAPPWMQRSGLEWLFRISQEPVRLWRRYLWNNPAFLGLLGIELIRHRARKLLTARS